MKNNLYVITGGPGVGKTTLLNELNSAGFYTVPEDARTVIKEQVKENGDGLPWKNKERYAALMLSASIDTYERVCKEQPTETVFFDRGILDSICYMQMENIPITKEIKELIINFPYANKVFILPPWKEIYETDTERKQTWEEAVFTFDKMKETYLEFGYNVIEVAIGTVEDRRKTVLDLIDESIK